MGRWFGLMLVAVGTYWLLDRLGYVDFRWSYIWPIAIIALGLSMLWPRRG